MSIQDLHPEKGRLESRKRLHAVRRGEAMLFETQWRKSDGTTVDVEVNSRVIDDEKAIIQGVARDITERKLAEQEREKLQAQLAQAQKIKAIGTLAGGIAHNFNNLLMSIVGNTSLMLLETDPDHPNYEKLKIIEKQVQNGSKLTYQLLGYAREGGYEVKPLSLNQLIKETSDTFAMTKKEIMVHRELAEDLLGAKADQDQIEQVLLNLYVNAADAMSGGGDLFLKTTNVTREDMRGKPYEAKPGDYVLLTVRDTGIGMDKKTMEKIFDPFFTTKGMARGTGLGLASVYGIVKAHGGYIDVESKKGHGTTFTIYLPASSEKISIKEKGLPKKILKGEESILLVDDEDIIIDVGEEMLKTLGYKVLIARGGKEAIKLYRKNKDKIDMVLLDMVMPEMGGGETYDRLKKIDPDIKVLLLSGYSIDGQATEILKRGCDGFIQKPFDVQGLSQRIRKILDKK
jgi:signal transduction histidine kinase/ActR/RegA family two-component response regulator